MTRRMFLCTAAAVGGTLIGARWSLAGPVTTDAVGDKVQTLPKGQLPQFADTAETRQLYRYAVEHGHELQYFPCVCGCANIGHKSNRDCYIKSYNKDGSLTFTSHAAT